MGIEQLTGRILDEARRKAQLIAEQGRQAAGEVRTKAAAEVARLEAEAGERTRAEAGTIVERARSQARLERRKVLLAAQWRAIDRAIEAARKAVPEEPGYRELVAGLVRRWGGPDWSVHLSPDDTRRFGAELGAGEPMAISGGVVLRAARQEVKLSLDEMLVSLRQELASELAAILFGGNPGP